jgi:hypothetical protein
MDSSGSEPWPFLQTAFNELHGRFSPDGRFVAYQSNESGRHEIYIRPFAPPKTPGGAADPGGGKWQVSVAGGQVPVWRADGRELYYLALNGDMMVTPITIRAATLEVGKPARLFPMRIHGGGHDSGQGRQYDVTKDGRFLINTVIDEAVPAPITLIQNWQPPSATP